MSILSGHWMGAALEDFVPRGFLMPWEVFSGSHLSNHLHLSRQDKWSALPYSRHTLFKNGITLDWFINCGWQCQERSCELETLWMDRNKGLLFSTWNLSKSCAFPWPTTMFFILIFWTTLFLFIFWPHLTVFGISVPHPGIEPGPPAVEAQNLNHWTTMELPMLIIFKQLYWDIIYTPYSSSIYVYKFNGFSLSTNIYSHHHNFRTFASLSKDTLYPLAITPRASRCQHPKQQLFLLSL